jgi:hypothetical protein
MATIAKLYQIPRHHKFNKISCAHKAPRRWLPFVLRLKIKQAIFQN